MARGCEHVVIGAGPGGYLAALRLAQQGRDVLLVDTRAALGGVCLNEGCIPSKALIHAANLASEARHAAAMGIEIGDVRVDLPKLVSWKDSVVKRLTGGVRTLTDKAVSKAATLAQGCALLWQHPQVRTELLELLGVLAEHGAGDLFPQFSGDEAQRVAKEGKIPVYASWKDRVRAGKASWDGMLTAAALASFTQDQQALDDRIQKQL